MYRVNISNNDTGEIRQRVESGNWSDEGVEYLWSEGNYSCDCNRSLHFRRADPAGKDDKDLSDECGLDKYSICVTDDAGIELYKDDDWDASAKNVVYPGFKRELLEHGHHDINGNMIVDATYKLQPEAEPNVDTGDDSGGRTDRVESPATGIREEGTSESDRVDQVQDEMGRLAALGELAVSTQ